MNCIPSERKFFESIQLTSGTTQFWSPGTRVFATMGRFDQLGTFLSFFFLLGTGLLYQLKDRIERQWLFIVIGLSIPAFIMTLSRASWFGFLLGLIVIGGLMLAGQVGIGSPVTGIDYTLISITAVVLGGASVAGGRGSFLATLMGAALVQTISSASSFINSDSAIRLTVLGVVTILAATFFSVARRNRS